MAGLVVPISRTAEAEGLRRPNPPDEPWALMAAAQMHAEGRLVQPEQKGAHAR